MFAAITMNWRGRPLTSHEVIVQTIAATTTRTGLTVRAGLDPASYPDGIKVSDKQMQALPLTRHDWHGDWNYTLHPEAPRTPATAAQAPKPARRDSTSWAHPALTGIPAAEWARLTAALAVPYQAHREARLHIARGGPARRKPAGGYPPALTVDEMILATVLRARFRLPQSVLAELFGVVTGTIANAEAQIRPLLCSPSFRMSMTATLKVALAGMCNAPPGGVPGGAGWTRCRGGGQSGGAVSSAMAVRAEDSSTMVLPAEQAASRAVMASRLIARGRPRAWAWMTRTASSVIRGSLETVWCGE